MTEKHTTERRARSAHSRPLRLLVLVAPLVWLGGPLDAGSIFMKNGYILQGPVVDVTDAAVVLGWENGKVSVARRFIDSVAYDAGEQQRIERVRQQKLEEEQRAEEIAMESFTRREFDELPADLEVFLRQYGEGVPKDGAAPSGEEEVLVAVSPAADSAADSVAEDAPTGEPDDSTWSTDVAVVERPEPEVVEETRVGLDDGAVSLRVPPGWTTERRGEALVLSSPESGERGGVRPSLNVLRLDAGGLSVEECVVEAKTEQSQLLSGYEVVTEQPREVGDGVSGHEIVARGSFEGQPVVVRQLFVPYGDSVWLLSGFSHGISEDPTFARIEGAIASVEFGQPGIGESAMGDGSFPAADPGSGPEEDVDEIGGWADAPEPWPEDPGED